MKDKEIQLVQNQLSQSYQEQQMEIEQKTTQLLQLQTELELKNKHQSSIAIDHKQSLDLLNGHVERLKDMLAQKTNLNEEMEAQNKLYLS